MNFKSTLRAIKKLESDYRKLDKELKNHKLLKSKVNFYTKEDKDDFLVLWKKYIQIFKFLQYLIKKSKYRSFLFRINYNKFVIRRYLLIFYFNCLVNLLNNFGKHEEFIRTLLLENFKYDYGEVAKYIYKPNFANILNTPYVFLKFRKHKIKRSFYFMLNLEKIEISNGKRILTDYKNFYFYFKYKIFRVLFFIARYFGKIIAKTRFSTRTKGLVTKKNLDTYLKVAKPGDILLARLNWEASNMSIPGFWKHMSIYLGSGKFLKGKFGKDFKFIDNLEDDVEYVIEATGKGVNIISITTFREESDYFGVTRPTFSQEKIYRAIKNSLKYFGYSYDYLFNFYSNTSVVCSELVIKSYAKEFDGDSGFDDLHLKKTGLILTYPPNHFISEIFSDKGQLIPIIFIDSLEKNLKNFISTNKEFEKSSKRSRFSIMLK